MNEKPYLLVVRLQDPKAPEHAGIVKTLEAVSGRAPATLMAAHSCVVLAFRSRMAASEISFRLSEAVAILSGDSYILVELGSDSWAHASETARAWFKNNLE